MAEKHETDSAQIAVTKRLVELAAQRTEMGAQITYMNAEMTLSVWVRIALGLMILGIAVDRFELFLRRIPSMGGRLNPNTLSMWVGVALVSLGIFIALATRARFRAYEADYRRNYPVPVRYGPFLGPFYALCVVIFGVALLVLMVVFAN